MTARAGEVIKTFFNCKNAVFKDSWWKGLAFKISKGFFRQKFFCQCNRDGVPSL